MEKRLRDCSCILYIFAQNLEPIATLQHCKVNFCVFKVKICVSMWLGQEVISTGNNLDFLCWANRSTWAGNILYICAKYVRIVMYCDTILHGNLTLDLLNDLVCAVLLALLFCWYWRDKWSNTSRLNFRDFVRLSFCCVPPFALAEKWWIRYA